MRAVLQGTSWLWTPICQQLQLGEQGCIHVAISNAETSACWASRGACSNRFSSASATVEPAVSSARAVTAAEQSPVGWYVSHYSYEERIAPRQRRRVCL